MGTHHYEADVVWTGNTGSGTSGHKTYERAHEIRVAGKATILGSSDPSFRGDPSRHNPEELLVASLAQCHMLWFLHLASVNGVVVTEYRDHATGTMAEHPDGSGRMTEVLLHPVVAVADPATRETAQALHEKAHSMCFIAASVNFPVRHEPTVV
ncbi:OsmC family protein [Lentzea jiangxiensis]|uniref:Organic hydroperoxide reductase OsmC/OhrA n=1 Tax=Lentzea jiangxiensis TaxID=641025 RepID=A0A1H0UAA5_9PSEU|nr:OsmC family protein [Lentzea jiangxiensis]SDP63207.1 Organic hydroperoxide reductase OsmC/OhrA [Lentzea jiangxiensis]